MAVPGKDPAGATVPSRVGAFASCGHRVVVPTVHGMAPALSLDDIQDRLEQLCEERCLAGFTAVEQATYERLAELEQKLLASRPPVQPNGGTIRR